MNSSFCARHLGLFLIAALALVFLSRATYPSPSHVSGVQGDVSGSSAPSAPVSAPPLPVIDARPVFLKGVPFEGRAQLTREDLPRIDPYRAARWNDRLYVAGRRQLGEYDVRGSLQRYADPHVLPCDDNDHPMYDVALIRDQLFTSCLNLGVFQIDLTRERLVGFYRQENGLKNIQNLRLALGPDDRVWVGTYDGLAVIDPRTGAVRFFKEELGTGCELLNTAPHAAAGQLWVEYTAHSTCPGGLLQWRGGDSWMRFQAQDFKQHDVSRIDFDRIIIGQDGRVRVLFRDDISFQGGDDFRSIVAFYDPSSKTWVREKDVTSISPQADALLGALDMQEGAWISSPYWHGDPAQASADYPGTVSVREVTHGTWERIDSYVYTSMVRDGSRIYAVRAGSLDVLEPDDVRFKSLVKDRRIPVDAAFSFDKTAGKFILIHAPRNEMGGSMAVEVSVLVIDARSHVVESYSLGSPPQADQEEPFSTENMRPVSFVTHGHEIWIENREARYFCFDPTKRQLRFCLQRR